MKTTTLLFPTVESLFSFVNLTKALNLSIVPKARIARGLFTVDEINFAVTRFAANIQNELFGLVSSSAAQ